MRPSGDTQYADTPEYSASNRLPSCFDIISKVVDSASETVARGAMTLIDSRLVAGAADAGSMIWAKVPPSNASGTNVCIEVEMEVFSNRIVFPFEAWPPTTTGQPFEPGGAPIPAIELDPAFTIACRMPAPASTAIARSIA